MNTIEQLSKITTVTLCNSQYNCIINKLFLLYINLLLNASTKKRKNL